MLRLPSYGGSGGGDALVAPSASASMLSEARALLESGPLTGGAMAALAPLRGSVELQASAASSTELSTLLRDLGMGTAASRAARGVAPDLGVSAGSLGLSAASLTLSPAAKGPAPWGASGADAAAAGGSVDASGSSWMDTLRGAGVDVSTDAEGDAAGAPLPSVAEEP
jgi:hypothetical protein